MKSFPSPTRAPIDLLFDLFLVALVLMPLPFGANRPWASDLFAVFDAIVLLGVAWALYRDPSLWPSGTPEKRLIAAALMFGLATFWIGMQGVAFTPAAWRHPLWESAQAGAISLDPGLLPESLARLLGYAACFVIAFIAGRDARRAQRMLKFFAVAAILYALYGLIAQAAGGDTILWYKKWAYRGFLTSTFVNKNSYATYCGFGLLACLALLWQRFKQYAPDWRKPDPRGAFYSLAVLMLAAALILTGSRGGVASTTIGCFVLALNLALNRRGGMRPALVALLGAGGLLAALLLAGDNGLIARLDPHKLGDDAAARLNVWRLTLEAINDNPWRGFGAGAFDAAFRLYRDARVTLWFPHAHNDFLETALELGVPAAALLLGAMILLVSCCTQGILRRHRREEFPALAFAAIILAAAHATVDFSLHIPAIAVSLSALLGLGVAQSWSSAVKDKM